MDADTAPAAAPAGLLSVLQYADSLFPSGASAFSWGLESMHADGMAGDAAAVLGLMQALIGQRWAGFDRPLLRAAHAAAAGAAHDTAAGTPAAAALEPIIAIDQLCEATTLNHGARAASRRLGFTQLRVHAELGLAAASAYLDLVRAARAPGHLPVMQGLVWRALGLTAIEAETMSAFGVCTALAGAAMRLGLIGHIEAQRLLTQMRASIEAALGVEPCGLDDLWNGAPALEIAAMRHEPRSARLFAS